MAMSTRDLLHDVLFRAGEPQTGGSQFHTAALDYLNRSYKALAIGASEFLPDVVEDWWWMRETDVLVLEPVYETGTVSVTQGSAAVTFSVAPATSLLDYRIRMEGHPDVFRIASHTAASTAATLDTVYTGPTAALNSFKAMKVTYALSAAVASLMSPIISYRDADQIHGLSPERMDFLWPYNRLGAGPPLNFSLEDPTTIRFSHGGRTDGVSMRVEYRYKPVVAELVDSAMDFPLVPDHYRHLLADMALTYLYVDKNDDRAQASSGSARSGLSAMYKENRRQRSKMSGQVGYIFPRQGYQFSQRGPLRTESGLIIG